MILLLCVAFPPIDLGEDVQMNLSGNSFFDPLIGLALIALAGLLLTRGVRDLGNSLTPFPVLTGWSGGGDGIAGEILESRRIRMDVRIRIF